MAYGSDTQKRLYYAFPPVLKDLSATWYGRREKKMRHGEYYERNFQQAERLQWLRGRQLENECLKQATRYLLNAAKTSLFYHRLFLERNFDPAKMSSLQDLRRLPILSKERFRNNMDRIISSDFGSEPAHWVHTSGTTGFGLQFPESSESFQREYAYRYNNYAQQGVTVDERWAFCAGHPVADPERRKPPFWVHDRANQWLLMSSAHLTERNLPLYIKELERFQPALLGGYPSSIYLLALANEHLGRPVAPKAIFTSSETLFSFQRNAIRESFGCQPRSYYGNGERCGFVAECEYGTFHSKQEHTYIELVNDDDTPTTLGKSGRLVGTSFGNGITPLIRYDTGDVATLSGKTTCPCGRGGLLLDEIVGRTEDYIVTPDGRLVGRLDHLFKDAQHVRMAQLYQENARAIEIRIVRASAYDGSDEPAILREARTRLGKDIEISVVYVEDVERPKGNKFRFILSKVEKKRIFATDLPTIPN